eukprot:jgi/Mesvir1/28008/Mv20197-RA.1
MSRAQAARKWTTEAQSRALLADSSSSGEDAQKALEPLPPRPKTSNPRAAAAAGLSVSISSGANISRYSPGGAASPRGGGGSLILSPRSASGIRSGRAASSPRSPASFAEANRSKLLAEARKALDDESEESSRPDDDSSYGDSPKPAAAAKGEPAKGSGRAQSSPAVAASGSSRVTVERFIMEEDEEEERSAGGDQEDGDDEISAANMSKWQRSRVVEESRAYSPALESLTKPLSDRGRPGARSGSGSDTAGSTPAPRYTLSRAGGRAGAGVDEDEWKVPSLVIDWLAMHDSMRWAHMKGGERASRVHDPQMSEESLVAEALRSWVQEYLSGAAGARQGKAGGEDMLLALAEWVQEAVGKGRRYASRLHAAEEELAREQRRSQARESIASLSASQPSTKDLWLRLEAAEMKRMQAETHGESLEEALKEALRTVSTTEGQLAQLRASIGVDPAVLQAELDEAQRRLASALGEQQALAAKLVAAEKELVGVAAMREELATTKKALEDKEFACRQMETELELLTEKLEVSRDRSHTSSRSSGGGGNASGRQATARGQEEVTKLREDVVSLMRQLAAQEAEAAEQRSRHLAAVRQLEEARATEATESSRLRREVVTLERRLRASSDESASENKALAAALEDARSVAQGDADGRAAAEAELQRVQEEAGDLRAQVAVLQDALAKAEASTTSLQTRRDLAVEDLRSLLKQEKQRADAAEAARMELALEHADILEELEQLREAVSRHAVGAATSSAPGVASAAARKPAADDSAGAELVEGKGRVDSEDEEGEVLTRHELLVAIGEYEEQLAEVQAKAEEAEAEAKRLLAQAEERRVSETRQAREHVRELERALSDMRQRNEVLQAELAAAKERKALASVGLHGGVERSILVAELSSSSEPSQEGSHDDGSQDEGGHDDASLASSDEGGDKGGGGAGDIERRMQVHRLMRTVEAYREEAEAARGRAEQLEEEVEGLHEQLNDVTAERQHEQDMARALAAEVRELQGKLREGERESRTRLQGSEQATRAAQSAVAAAEERAREAEWQLSDTRQQQLESVAEASAYREQLLAWHDRERARQAEAQLLHDQIEELQGELDEGRHELEAMRSQLDEMVAQRQHEQGQARADAHMRDSEVACMHEELIADATVHAEQMDHAMGELAAARGAAEAAAERNRQLEQQLTSLQEEMEANAALHGHEVDALKEVAQEREQERDQEMQELRERVAALEGEAERRQQEADEDKHRSEQEVEMLREEVEQLTEDLHAARKEVALNAEIVAVLEDYKNKLAAMEEAKKHDQELLQQRAYELLATQRQLEEKYAEAEDERQRYERQLKGLEAKIHNAAELYAAMEAERADYPALLASTQRVQAELEAERRAMQQQMAQVQQLLEEQTNGLSQHMEEEVVAIVNLYEEQLKRLQEKCDQQQGLSERVRALEGSLADRDQEMSRLQSELMDSSVQQESEASTRVAEIVARERALAKLKSELREKSNAWEQERARWRATSAQLQEQLQQQHEELSGVLEQITTSTREESRQVALLHERLAGAEQEVHLLVEEVAFWKDRAGREAARVKSIMHGQELEEQELALFESRCARLESENRALKREVAAMARDMDNALVTGYSSDRGTNGPCALELDRSRASTRGGPSRDTWRSHSQSARRLYNDRGAVEHGYVQRQHNVRGIDADLVEELQLVQRENALLREGIDRFRAQTRSMRDELSVGSGRDGSHASSTPSDAPSGNEGGFAHGLGDSARGRQGRGGYADTRRSHSLPRRGSSSSGHDEGAEEDESLMWARRVAEVDDGSSTPGLGSHAPRRSRSLSRDRSGQERPTLYQDERREAAATGGVTPPDLVTDSSLSAGDDSASLSLSVSYQDSEDKRVASILAQCGGDEDDSSGDRGRKGGQRWATRGSTRIAGASGSGRTPSHRQQPQGGDRGQEEGAVVSSRFLRALQDELSALREMLLEVMEEKRALRDAAAADSAGAAALIREQQEHTAALTHQLEQLEAAYLAYKREMEGVLEATEAQVHEQAEAHHESEGFYKQQLEQASADLKSQAQVISEAYQSQLATLQERVEQYEEKLRVANEGTMAELEERLKESEANRDLARVQEQQLTELNEKMLADERRMATLTRQLAAAEEQLAAALADKVAAEHQLEEARRLSEEEKKGLQLQVEMHAERCESLQTELRALGERLQEEARSQVAAALAERDASHSAQLSAAVDNTRAAQEHAAAAEEACDQLRAELDEVSHAQQEQTSSSEELAREWSLLVSQLGEVLALDTHDAPFGTLERHEQRELIVDLAHGTVEAHAQAARERDMCEGQLGEARDKLAALKKKYVKASLRQQALQQYILEIQSASSLHPTSRRAAPNRPPSRAGGSSGGRPHSRSRGIASPSHRAGGVASPSYRRYAGAGARNVRQFLDDSISSSTLSPNEGGRDDAYAYKREGGVAYESRHDGDGDGDGSSDDGAGYQGLEDYKQRAGLGQRTIYRDADVHVDGDDESEEPARSYGNTGGAPQSYPQQYRSSVPMGAGHGGDSQEEGDSLPGSGDSHSSDVSSSYIHDEPVREGRGRAMASGTERLLATVPLRPWQGGDDDEDEEVVGGSRRSTPDGLTPALPPCDIPGDRPPERDGRTWGRSGRAPNAVVPGLATPGEFGSMTGERERFPVDHFPLPPLSRMGRVAQASAAGHQGVDPGSDGTTPGGRSGDAMAARVGPAPRPSPSVAVQIPLIVQTPWGEEQRTVNTPSRFAEHERGRAAARAAADMDADAGAAAGSNDARGLTSAPPASALDDGRDYAGVGPARAGERREEGASRGPAAAPAEGAAEGAAEVAARISSKVAADAATASAGCSRHSHHHHHHHHHGPCSHSHGNGAPASGAAAHMSPAGREGMGAAGGYAPSGPFPAAMNVRIPRLATRAPGGGAPAVDAEGEDTLACGTGYNAGGPMDGRQYSASMPPQWPSVADPRALAPHVGGGKGAKRRTGAAPDASGHHTVTASDDFAFAGAGATKIKRRAPGGGKGKGKWGQASGRGVSVVGVGRRGVLRQAALAGPAVTHAARAAAERVARGKGVTALHVPTFSRLVASHRRSLDAHKRRAWGAQGRQNGCPSSYAGSSTGAAAPGCGRPRCERDVADMDGY